MRIFYDMSNIKDVIRLSFSGIKTTIFAKGYKSDRYHIVFYGKAGELEAL